MTALISPPAVPSDWYMADRSPTGVLLARRVSVEEDGTRTILTSTLERQEISDTVTLYSTEAEALAAARRRWRR